MNGFLLERRAELAMLGGVLVPVTLGVFDVAPEYVGIAVVVPVLLGFGLVELYSLGVGSDGSTGGPGTTGRAGLVLAAVGLSLLLLAMVAFAVLPPSIVVPFVLAVPVVAGSVALALGSGLLALVLRRLGFVSGPAVALLGFGVPAVPVLRVAFSVGFGSTISGPASAVCSGVPYGLGWVLVASRLRTAEQVREPESAGSVTTTRTVSPHSLVIGLVGGAFVVLSAGRFLPLGALSHTPWVGQRLVVDALHLLVGGLGVLVASRSGPRRARSYERTVGVCALGLVAVTLSGTFLQLPGFQWLATNGLALNLTDLVVYVPAGLVLTAVGFGVDVDDSAPT